MLHKSISVTKYFISVSVWVPWAVYCDFKKILNFRYPIFKSQTPLLQ